ncbi:MAG: ROK family protein, partial [Candidatus Dormibacteraceae bacterium]
MIAGIDLGGTQIRVAVAGSDGRILGTRRARTPELGGPAGTVRWAAAAIGRLARSEPVWVAGVGAPGPLDPVRGVLVNPPNLPGWRKNLPLGQLLSDALRAPVHVENDANVAAVGELTRGAGRGARNLVYVTWSTGIGSGLILEGRLFAGAHGTAGEVGHMILDPGGPLCACGQRG